MLAPLLYWFYGTWCSQAVSHPKTNQAQPCQASEFRSVEVRVVWQLTLTDIKMIRLIGVELKFSMEVAESYI